MNEPDTEKSEEVVAEMVSGFAAGHELVEHGAFSFDRERASAKLPAFRVADPNVFVLMIVEAAHLLDCERVQFFFSNLGMSAILVGAQLSREELSSMRNMAFVDPSDLGSAEARRTLARARLGLALELALALPHAEIELISARGGPATRMVFGSDEPQLSEECVDTSAHQLTFTFQDETASPLSSDEEMSSASKKARRTLLRQFCAQRLGNISRGWGSVICARPHLRASHKARPPRDQRSERCVANRRPARVREARDPRLELQLLPAQPQLPCAEPSELACASGGKFKLELTGQRRPPSRRRPRSEPNLGENPTELLGRVGDLDQAHPALASLATQDVDREHPPQQPRPGVPRASLGLDLDRDIGLSLGLEHQTQLRGLGLFTGARNHFCASLGASRQYAVVG